MITINNNITNPKDFVKSELPLNAIKIERKPSLPRIIAILAVLTATVLISEITKTGTTQNGLIVQPISFVGIILYLPLMYVHEWLHAILYPKEANVTMGIYKRKGRPIFITLSSYPLSKSRFLLMLLLPNAIGVILLIAYIASPVEYHMLNGLLLGMVYMGMLTPVSDINTAIDILKQSQKNDKIFFHEDGLFKVNKQDLGKRRKVLLV